MAYENLQVMPELDPNKDYTIEELTNYIRNAMTGKNVREALARSIEATNEIATWARDVAQGLIDGAFDAGELATMIESKLNQLEQDYAPKLTSLENEIEDARGSEQTLGDRLDGVSSQLAQIAKKFEYPLGNKIASNIIPNNFTFLGDSTGNEKSEWIYKTSKHISNAFSDRTCIYRLWDDTTKSYTGYETLNRGADEGHVKLRQTDLGYIFTNHSNKHNLTKGIDVTIKVGLENWSAETQDPQVLVGKFGGSGNRSWLLGYNNFLKKPYFWWSENGTDLIGGDSNPASLSTEPIDIKNGEAIWLRGVLTFSNDSGVSQIDYYTSENGETWERLGDSIIGTSPTFVYNADFVMEIGSRSTGTGKVKGNIYEIIIRDGYNGRIVASPNFGVATGSTFYDAEGNEWRATSNATFNFLNGNRTLYVLNGSHPGASIMYPTTYFTQLNPMESGLTFISYSHNETTDDYTPAYTNLINLIKTNKPNSGIVCVTQNPQKASSNPYVDVEKHALRNEQIKQIAEDNNYLLIDAFNTFLSVEGYENLISSDGVHPLVTGSELWASVAKRFLNSIFGF